MREKTAIVSAYIDGQHLEQRTAPTIIADRGYLAEPPERLERQAHRCNVIDEYGRECQTWTLHPRGCLKHRRQPASGGACG